MNEHYKFSNSPLPYAYDAMEPYIDEKTMWLHHDRHLQTYIDDLNDALAKYPQFQSWSLETLLGNIPRLPQDIQTDVKNNAGGVFNHRFYFENLLNPAPAQPTGQLKEAINKKYGNYQRFKEQFKEEASSVFGSGYAWLVVDDDGQLKIITTKNQDTPVPLEMCPVLNIDVWEHAYYLKHYNLRDDYIDDWFQVVNWDNANDNYEKCL
ncbi:superoxide dismutase [Clostridium sp. C105KSO13]|uniref:superoxide dismutase n=1 Tax=Clostridium sp. C105KSO13 TaxID=1776045 RepID=UPI00074075F6|nr:superoxide dismutase [Clostridium sp. C105KSO13]CUX36386.1 Superoxide dismutase [Mn] 2 [Clostridium sp. C105KSO13]